MLFEPLTIGSLRVENRLMRSATWEGMATDAGEVSDPLVALYRDLARGGVGIIVTGFAYVRPDGKALPGQTGIYDDQQMAGLARVAEAVHAEGGRVVVQIVHAGAQTRPEWIAGEAPWAPSQVDPSKHQPAARALPAGEIAAIAEAFGQAARRAQEAGFDGVQLHLAHGYLLSQFLSPHRNQRSDAFGGSAENRRRAPLLALEAVRDAVGPGFPVLAKMNSTDGVEGGLEIDEAVAHARAFVAAGLDAIEVSGGIPAAGSKGASRPGIRSREDEAYFRGGGAAVKAAVDVPVYLVGGLRSPELMEEIIASGDADGVSLCRPFIREPDLPERWSVGDPAVSECISCRKCLKAGMAGGIRCVDLYPEPRPESR